MTNRQIADKVRNLVYQELKPFIGKNVSDAQDEIRSTIRRILNELVSDMVLPREDEGGYNFSIDVSIGRPVAHIQELEITINMYPRYEPKALNVSIKVP